jgi:hypothetical protein
MPQGSYSFSEANSAQRSLYWIVGTPDSAQSAPPSNSANVAPLIVGSPQAQADFAVGYDLDRIPGINEVFDLILASPPFGFQSQHGSTYYTGTGNSIRAGVALPKAAFSAGGPGSAFHSVVSAYRSSAFTGSSIIDTSAVTTTGKLTAATLTVSLLEFGVSALAQKHAPTASTVVSSYTVSTSGRGQTTYATLVGATDPILTTNAAALLTSRILTEQASAEIDNDSVKTALAATDDALTLVRHNRPGGVPRIMYSNDGILTLQWERDDYGVALLFCGDGTVSIAFRRPGLLYAENGIEAAVSEKLPPKFQQALSIVLKQSENVG